LREQGGEHLVLEGATHAVDCHLRMQTFERGCVC
jgi:hypothetical protein